MSKKFLTLLSVLLLGAMVLGACQPAPEATAEPTEEMAEPTEEMAEPTEEMAEPTEEMAEPTEEMAETEEAVTPDASIRVWADDTRAAVLVTLADVFLETYNVELVVEEVTGIRDQFIIAAPAGEGPDIIVGAHSPSYGFEKNDAE